jgi:hypothetical protein
VKFANSVKINGIPLIVYQIYRGQQLLITVTLKVDNIKLNLETDNQSPKEITKGVKELALWWAAFIGRSVTVVRIIDKKTGNCIYDTGERL